ncbi:MULTISPECIES: UDP-glucose 4-epimerase GalE [Enterococcus]|uniref:UDP-glucose 4-epimerase n=1 Tax=Candidatus Enterococcus murrayae TaxID=2815321 RepID=A0ABS3HD41_9ENTE|nr:UDP-glucose 4-epimerase GalE [Enterococcus sp. MJM16]MBO0451118.1 UDP-glucose 4-epimerase GalE [Enterococcus sp. MJM16]
MTVLILGGAGYIGSNAVDGLIMRGYEVAVIDNLSTGHKRAIHKAAHFYEGDIRDKELLRKVFKEEKIDAVMHFAALSLGRESVEQPLKYFSNNVYGTEVVLETMQEFEVKSIVFSSSATIYGNTKQSLVDETTEAAPINPYGESKRMMETIMTWQSQASEMNFVALRYFNVAGAKKDGTLGEVRPRLIPVILQVASGEKDTMVIFGDDYPTIDGTCVRDYIHVLDLVEAHILALEYLQRGGASQILNVGSAKGYSNLEVVNACREVTGRKIPLEIRPGAKGDAASLVASNDKIKEVLGWSAKHSDIKEIISDSWRFQKDYPNGY